MIQNFISKLSPKEKKVFYVAAAFVLTALLDRLFIGPTMSRLKSLDEEITQEENVIKGDLRLLSYKNKILKEDKDFSIFYAKKAQAQEEIIAEFLKKIEILATESKVNLAKVTPADSKQKKGFIEYYADLECDGTLENVAKFMYAINSSVDLLKVVTFNLSPKKAGSDEVISNMTVTKIIIDASSVEQAKEMLRELAIEKSSGTKGRGSTQGGGGAKGGGSAGGSEDGASAGAAGGAGGSVTGEINSGAMGGTGSGGVSGSFQASDAKTRSSSPALSERLQMKGFKQDGKQEAPKEEEIEEIKPSVWERIMQKESGQEGDNAQ